MKRFHKFLYLSLVTILVCVLIASALAQVSKSFGGRSFSGQFNAEIACNFDDETSVTTYSLTTGKSKTYDVVFNKGTTPPMAGAWTTLRGRLKGNTIFATSATSFMPAGGLTHTATGEQRTVVALVNFQNDLTENVTVEQVEDRMFDPLYSIDQWWQENSYGKTWGTGDVFGWLTLPMNRACSPSQIRTLTIQALDPLTNLTQYNRLYILIPGAGGCSWGGLGTLGASTYSTNDGPWTTTTSWTRSEYFNETRYNPRSAVFVTAHEFGHNFGRSHSQSITWSNNDALGPFDCGGCGGTVTAYADRFCSLGGGWRPGHFNAVLKRVFNWFDPEHEVTVTRTGIYEIDPYSLGSSDPKVLRIHRGFGPTMNRDEYLTVEWRQPIGYDAEVNYLGGEPYDGVLLHWDHRSSNQQYNPDMTPGDGEMRNATLRSGVQWDDLYTNMSIKPLGPVNGMMQVQVTIGNPVLASTFAILRGQHVSGGLTEINQSDDQRFSAKAWITLTPEEPPIWIEFVGHINDSSPGSGPEALRFELESLAESRLDQRVEMYNFQTSSWELASVSQTTPTDSFIEANVWSNATRFIEPLTGKLRTRVQYKASGLTLNWPWQVDIDQAVWKILR